MLSKTINDLKKEGFISNSKNKCPNDEEMKGTKEITKLFKIGNREQLTKLYCKSDVILLADVFEEIIKV